MNSQPTSQHPQSINFPIIDGCLQIGGMPLTRLVKLVGGTPFFAYDREHISRRVGELRANLPEDIYLSYAMKANPMPAVVQHLSGLVDGFDIASGGELRIALDTPMSESRVSFAGPGKTPAELGQAIAAGVLINLESEAEMECVASIGDRHGITPRVAIRVNPDFELRASGLRMSGGSKPFGVDTERLPDMLRRLGQLDLDFEGYHIFCGSQNLDAEFLREAQEKTIELAIRLSEPTPGPVRIVNIGGGFGIPYFPGQAPLDLPAVGDNLKNLMGPIRRRLPKARIVLELGRYLVGEAGIYVCQVIDRKESRGQMFLVTAGGLHHHLTASGNLGTVIRRNFPVAIGNKMAMSECESINVVGCLCTPFDILAEQVRLPPAEVGDFVVIFQSGAYGRTASPSAFLSHPAPVEALV